MMSAQQSQDPVPALDADQLAEWTKSNDGSEKSILQVSLPYEVARRTAAFHEAGHAVVTAAYGAHIRVTGVVDVPLAPGEVGWSITGRTEFDGPPIPPWRYAAQCAAGERAGIHYLQTAGLWSPQTAKLCAHHDDFDSAASSLRDIDFLLSREDDGTSDMSWTAACRLADLMLALLWPRVCAVALAGGTNPAPYAAE